MSIFKFVKLNWKKSLVLGGMSIAAIVAPAMIPCLAYGIMQGLYYLGKLEFGSFKIAKPLPFVTLAYGYLPLVLGGNLAHYLKMGLEESGQIIPVTFATFGQIGNDLPSFIADPAVITFLQATTLIGALSITFFLTQKIAKRPIRSLIPQHLASVCLVVTLWISIVGN